MKSGMNLRSVRPWLCLAGAGLLLCVGLLTAAWGRYVPAKPELTDPARPHRIYGRDALQLPRIDAPRDQLRNWQGAHALDRSIIVDNTAIVAGVNNATAAPGLQLAVTMWDAQHNDAAPHQIAASGSGEYIHFVWTGFNAFGDSLFRVDRFVNFQSYNSATGQFSWGPDGAIISGAGCDPLQAHAGFVTIDVDDADKAIIAAQQRDCPAQPNGDYCSYYWEQGASAYLVFTEGTLPGSRGTPGNLADDKVYPHVTVDRQTGADWYYVLSHTESANDNIVMWRYTGSSWQGPYVIDSSSFLSYNIAADPTSDRIALVTTNNWASPSNPNGLNQIVYRLSTSRGDDWGPVNTSGLGDGNRVAITSYNNSSGSAAWTEVVGDYDNAGDLHIVWVEQRYNGIGDQAALMHWDMSSNTISTISQAYFDNKGQNSVRKLNVGFPTIGFGDGSTSCGNEVNFNYVYLTFVQFGGNSATEQADMSSKGYMNGEIYLSVSNDGGLHWSPAKNLTNSHNPGCDPALADSCPSENWPSLARTVDDTLHLMYINDRDAGDAPFGQGNWTQNPVMYYRIPGGTDAHPICPQLAPNVGVLLTDIQGPDCEYNTPPNTVLSEHLVISNLGSAVLTGMVSKTYINPPSGVWLTVTTGPYTIPVGGVNLSFPVAMNATGLAQGLYTAQISVTHNDPTKTSPIVIPVDFFVFNSFACPQYVVLHTKWLELEVSNIERVAVGPSRSAGNLRGLYRSPSTGSPDSGNNSIYDASLIIGRPPVDISRPPDGILDTVVYRYLYGTGNYAKGFRALSSLTVDTSRYGTNAGMAYARANQTTVDSLIGIGVEYQFPQNADSSNFVLMRYDISNRTTSPIPGLVVGEAADFDIKPPGSYMIPEIRDKGGVNPGWNLVYQQGADTAGTMAPQKYLAGMTSIQCGMAPRGWVEGDFGSFLPGFRSPFSEQYLYRNLVQTGFEATMATGELVSYLAFEQNINLTPTTEKHYMLGFVTSTAGPDTSDLMATTRKAWRFAFGWQNTFLLDQVPPGTPKSYRYFVLGSHENGPASGCCGCIVTKVSDPSHKFTLIPDSNNCTGTVTFAGSYVGTYTAILRATTLPCSGPTYTDDWAITVWTESPCSCPNQGDINGDVAIDVFDVIGLIGIAFSNDPDPQDPSCPATRGDVNNDGVSDVFDVIFLIATAFSGGQNPFNPCP